MEEEKSLIREKEKREQPCIFTLKKGTRFYSGPYPDGGEFICRAEEDITTGVYTDKKHKKQSSIGWIFFPTTHQVPYGGDPKRQIPAWVAKTHWKQQGFVKG
ncbi:hypothetical protein COU95_02105 [Candidatus Shapirobacteria bacterium CG10_big_fil_rev_8_21_14_0_10_40_9]|uniref:Uncharacterized protein n=1 Tax=Candidatus Shapirobacteria bacterium CG10_big_fil_rev_8_21_14_0_10_40_9 TaxID=1974888 RepID=A0A2M8L3Q8_9BACT|nr:MAG: hypothetical protein COU95_02105 [Candidatus Shapirobacteria bacterium CG10_big_fil_rev_8_21_14_0_10_40_9]